jgi:hypothetical protein
VDKDSKRIQRYLLEDEDIIQVFAFSQNEPWGQYANADMPI